MQPSEPPTSMFVLVRADDALTHVALRGRLDIRGVNGVQDQFVFNTTSRHKPTLVDLSEVTFIASLGIGMLVGAARALQKSGAKLVILAPQSLVLQVLEAAGIDGVIPIVHEESDALELLR
jgi:anti-anti-sigma factor